MRERVSGKSANGKTKAQCGERDDAIFVGPFGVGAEIG